MNVRQNVFRAVLRGLRRREGAAHPTAQPARIAIMRLHNIGDVVTATGLVRALRARYPDARLAFVTNPAAAPLIANEPALDTVIAPKLPGLGRGGRGPGHLLGLVQAGWHLRRAMHHALEGPATAIFCLEHGEALHLLALVPARWKVGFAAGDGHHAWALTHRVTSWGQSAGKPLLYRYRLYQALLERFTGETLTPVPTGLCLPDSAKAVAADWLRARGVGDRFVVLAPGGTAVTRRWPPERFHALGRALAARGDVDVVVLGGPAEAAMASEVAAPGTIDGIGALDITATAAVIGRAAAIVANDTSLMHMAVALGTPTLAIFGGSPWQRAGYEPEKMTALHADLSCQPCGLETCPYDTVPPCLNAVEAEHALEGLEPLLGDAKAR